MHDKNEEFVDEDHGILNNLNTGGSELEIVDDWKSVASVPEKEESIHSKSEVKEKKNEIIAKGRNGSIIIKIIHKNSKNEVAMKEISKKGKSIK